MILEKAQQLYQQDEAPRMPDDSTGMTAIKRNLENADTSTKQNSLFCGIYGWNIKAYRARYFKGGL
jgi:hypothetical protein